MLNKLAFLPLFIWQIPQHILGILLRLYWFLVTKNNIRVENYNTSKVFWVTTKSSFSGVSLGNFIFIKEGFDKSDPQVVAHEYGHSIQSMMFGPLYLLIVGLPSMSMAIWSLIWFNRIKRQKEVDLKEEVKKIHKWYYGKWPECHADRLGKVIRKL